MHHITERALTFALALAGAGALAPAQTPHDPEQDNRIAARVIGAADGLPRPGAVIHVTGVTDRSRMLTPEGYVLAEESRIRRLRDAATVRTDPEGRAWLDRAVVGHLYLVTLGGAHYAAAVPKVVDGEVVIRAVDMEPVGVRAFDTDGTPLRRFGVALRGGGEDLSVALTDDTGRAVLAAPAGFTARLTVLPASWVGPTSGFPTIAESLQGRRGVELRLPPHAPLRLRAMRGGEPQKVAIGGVTLSDPATFEILHSRNLPAGNMVDAFGVEFPFAALGFDFEAHAYIDRTWRRLPGKGPRTAGERLDFDVELPWRPEIALRLRGTNRAMPLRLTAVTDAGRVQAFGDVDAAGAVEARFRDGLGGRRLLRLEVDGKTKDPDSGHGTAWHVAWTGELDLSSAVVDLGELTWHARPPQMRGRVVDERGAPIPKASVSILRNGRANDGAVVQTEADGRFEFVGPLFRADEGTLLPATATARLGDRRSEPSGLLAAGAEVELTIRLGDPAPPRAPRAPPAPGSLVAKIADVPAGVRAVKLLGAGNFSFEPASTRETADGFREYVFERLRPGRYTLCAVSMELGRFAVLDGLEVPAGGRCPDERLAGFGLMDHVVFLEVRVVDREGVPMAGVQLTGEAFRRTTDGTGTARIPVLRGVASGALVEAPGMRSQRFAGLRDGQTVTLAPPGTLTVTVRGIPADVAREHVEVWVRDEVRERFAGPRGPVGEGDVLRVSMPPQGRYYPYVLVRTSATATGGTWTGVYRGEDVLVIGEGPDQEIEVRLDEAAVARLREALAKLR